VSPAVDVAELAGGRASLGAFDPGRRGLRALLVVAAVVVVIAGYLFWRGQPRVEPLPATPPPTAVAGTESASSGSIVVAVTGRVAHPGVFRLPAGARVQDAVDAAGGVLPGTDLTLVNLARRLNDGELVAIGVTGAPVAPGGGPATAGGRVNLNTAGAGELDTLPGIGPALAQRIIDYRTGHGGFRSIDELRKVEGIGDAKFAELRNLVTV
jgi:competence protein ComEA